MDLTKEYWLIWGLPESKFFVLARQHFGDFFFPSQTSRFRIFLWQKFDEIRVHWVQLGPPFSFEMSFVQSLNRG